MRIRSLFPPAFLLVAGDEHLFCEAVLFLVSSFQSFCFFSTLRKECDEFVFEQPLNTACALHDTDPHTEQGIRFCDESIPVERGAAIVNVPSVRLVVRIFLLERLCMLLGNYSEHCERVQKRTGSIPGKCFRLALDLRWQLFGHSVFPKKSEQQKMNNVFRIKTQHLRLQKLCGYDELACMCIPPMSRLGQTA
jgi:hypothetical protein